MSSLWVYSVHNGGWRGGIVEAVLRAAKFYAVLSNLASQHTVVK
jgi:hypothetical protein